LGRETQEPALQNFYSSTAVTSVQETSEDDELSVVVPQLPQRFALQAVVIQ
jgi:hypothetical protein